MHIELAPIVKQTATLRAENMIPNLGDLAVAVTFPTNANMVQDWM